eukprot:scaffold6459_cov21-Cyclotella_meneghiniana.AAC.1
MASNEPSDDEDWDEYTAPRGGSQRYPVHDACEFEDVDTLRRLIFVPQSEDDSSDDNDDDSNNNDSSSSSSSDDDTSHAQMAEQAAAMGRSPITAALSRE